MTTETIYRFPAPRGGVAELTEAQYRKLTGPGGLTSAMLHRIAGAALLLPETDADEGRRLKQVVRQLRGDAEGGPTNMERRAMVALIDAGLVRHTGQNNKTRYFRVGDAQRARRSSPLSR